ncbi:hypothetical protein SEUCBS140593_010762 [Sporothrix eucalyptigena]|uniref:O-methyltransferase C-terminal domain-containing protein n=1 Tax=Sporothrix eucalyptigena TaxID=1812306 RepID=A0ABP0D2N6_9PEZI
MSQATIDEVLVMARDLTAALKSHDLATDSTAPLLKRVGNIRAALETPFDMATRWLEAMGAASAMQVLTRIKAFEKLPTNEDGSSITAADLAAACNVDVSVITRAMRVLVINGIAQETNKDAYAHNQTSLEFMPRALGSMVCMFVEFARAWAALPAYAACHAPADLFDLYKTPFAYAVGREGKTYYECYENEDDDEDDAEEKRSLWNIGMQQLGNHIPVTGMFPFEALRESVRRQPDRPFVVDVGGGRGQALLAIQKHCQGDAFGGKLVLQDLPVVLASLSPEDLPGIEPMPYNIFTPQPVKGESSYAHIYFFRHLLIDYPDHKAVEILRNTVSAMGPDSRLLINDMPVPDRTKLGDDHMVYLFDFMLLTMCGRERSMLEYGRIFDQVGLELIATYKDKNSQMVVLETRLKRSE